MTQIKLRRDTAANFTSKNPVLGVGEPAYETDTKKLKIGDGTTAYTQLEYFSAGGGGGSTNISATLPLKIIDGVISLEVDGQTIQIVDGKLHANLDELGNEVNDLSGRVTAAEADILTKENKITTTGALSLQEKVKTNAVGFTVTSETAMTNDHYQRLPFPESQSSRLYIQDSSFTYPYKSYLAIPYSLGQVIRVPRAYGQLFFGSFDDNGDFIVSVGFNTFYYSTNGFALYGGPVYRAVAGSNEYPPVMPKLNPTQMGYDGNYTYKTPPREAADSGDLYSLSNYLPENDFSCAFYQISPDTTGAIMIQAFWSITNGRCSTAVYRDTETSYQYAGHLDAMRNNIQYALWLPNETGTSYNPSKFGLYDWNVSRIPWGNKDGWEAFFKGRGPNLYSLTGQSSKNYLELNLGDGLSVVDGKLTSTGLTELPIASTTTLGGIKVGGNLSITEDGTLSATDGGLEVKVAPSGDLNSSELLETGLYYITGGRIPQNAPSDYAVRAMLVTMKKYIAANNQCIQQTWIGCDDPVANQIYTRYSRSNGVMTSWVRVDSNKIASASALGSIKVGDGLTISSDGTLSASGGGSAPANMVTTDTTQTITGLKTFANNITLDQRQSESGIQCIYTNDAGSTVTSTFIQPQNFSLGAGYATLNIGLSDVKMILQGSTIKDSSGNKFLTSGDKETIMGYIMPDYSTRTEVPWDTDNTAPMDGYVEVMGEGNGSTSAFVLEYTINGVKTAVSGCYAPSPNTNFRLPVICPKGTVYRASRGAVKHELHFISMKGAV